MAAFVLAGENDAAPALNRFCDSTAGLTVSRGTEMFVRFSTGPAASASRGFYAVAYISISGEV